MQSAGSRTLPERRMRVYDFQNTAYFVRHPFTIKDLRVPHLYNRRKPFAIEKTVTLGKIDYENFITDLCVERWFIEENRHLCRVDGDGVWHCILVRQRGSQDGVLVMSEGEEYPKHAAYYPGSG